MVNVPTSASSNSKQPVLMLHAATGAIGSIGTRHENVEKSVGSLSFIFTNPPGDVKEKRRKKKETTAVLIIYTWY